MRFHLPWPGEVAVLDLSHNKLGIIRDADLANCSNLTTLDLSFNQINTIEQLAFNDLRHLNELVLSNNQLIYGNRSSLPADLFHNVKLLKSMKIENNFARSEKNLVKTDEFLKTLPTSLTSIHAQFPYYVEHCLKFLKLFQNLTELGMYVGQTEITITNNTFQVLLDLPIKKLKLEVNKLFIVKPLGFQWFPLLTDLDMSNSKGLTVMQFLDSAHSTLKQTNLTRLKLTSFKQHYKGGGSQVVYLKREVFPAVATTFRATSGRYGYNQHRIRFSSAN